ncbi:IS1 family transposase [Serratia sp. T13T92]|uniref:IS1 family transposase n=1 Tax=Serratia sp. T13T92 TaxID=3397496 RepID=UPI0039E0653D
MCCEANEHWSDVLFNGNTRWLFYAYDRIRKRSLVNVFGLRNASSLRRFLDLQSKINIDFYMRFIIFF